MSFKHSKIDIVIDEDVDKEMDDAPDSLATSLDDESSVSGTTPVQLDYSGNLNNTFSSQVDWAL